ncbi:hypothetical protein ACFY3U_15065 [Micromonospora sp. NPDC000089]|uniref:hypothetical protein n=1 Tax=unclassified Micromonospora TaxID=2617518 RepID=UPI00369DCF68
MAVPYRRTAVLVTLAALAASQQACAAEDPGGTASTPSPTLVASATVESTPATPSAPATGQPGPTPTGTTATATPRPTAAPAGLLSGKRQVQLFARWRGSQVPESVLTVGASGRAEVSGDFGDRALFVPVPAPGGRHQIKTGKLRSGGEPYCLSIKTNGSKPLTLVAAACDTRQASQFFTFVGTGKDNQGRATYAVQNRDAYLRWNPEGSSGLIAEELADSGPETTFVLVDKGPASLPALD